MNTNKKIILGVLFCSFLVLIGCDDHFWEEVMKEIAAMKWAYGKGTVALCHSERPFYAGLPGFGACMTETEFHSYYELSKKEKHPELADAYTEKISAFMSGKEKCKPDKQYYVGGLFGLGGECLSEQEFTNSILKKYPEINKHPLPPVADSSSILGPAIKPVVEALKCSKPEECRSYCLGAAIQHRTCDKLTNFCKETMKTACPGDGTCVLGAGGPECIKAYVSDDKRCPAGVYYDVRTGQCISCGKNAVPTAEGKCRCVTESYVPDAAGGCREKTPAEKQQETPLAQRQCTFSSDCKATHPDMDTCIGEKTKRRYDCINYKCVPYDFACGRGCKNGECI